ncbi:HDOD domain-containing protein [Gynuella sp.]|uniref:HDOD domain-containing protein n=1 Tax=Gynuella sp. TaxID=2969146 RepID=UPI003D13D330
MSKLLDTVRTEIFQAIEADQLTLPTLPEVAMKVREKAEDPEASISELVKVISQDAALAARIIKVTNSPLLRAPQEVKDLSMAVSRLGMNYTANLATGLAMEQMFQATSDIIDQRMRATWNSTTQIAAISHVLAQKFTRIPADEVTLCALVHKLGVLPILTFAEERDDLIRDGISLDKIITILHPDITVMILKKWDFPEAVQEVAKSYQNFKSPVSTVGYTEIIRLASLIHYYGQKNLLARVDWKIVPAFTAIGIEPDPESEQIQEIISEAQQAQEVFI